MKILTKEEEQAHYNATVKGGTIGGVIGLAVVRPSYPSRIHTKANILQGGAAAVAANARFHTFRNLTLPMKAFLVSSTSTFCAIIAADRSSRGFESSRDPARHYRDRTTSELEQLRKSEPLLQRVKDWGRENRYSIVTASWVASMGVALGLVGRDPYLSRSQKLVQARVYAQGLTIAILLATALLEVGDARKGQGRWETVKIVDPNDPEHKNLIEKRIHHEAYEGEDLWRGMLKLFLI
jgi:hypothetical protein